MVGRTSTDWTMDAILALAALGLPVLSVVLYHWPDRPAWTETVEQRLAREERERYARMRAMD